MELRLQPLRIPTGWQVDYNDGLWEIDPSDATISEDERWWLFKEDMLQLTHPRFNRLLDVGWYPGGDLAQGQYGLVLYEGDFGGRLLFQLRTRDRLDLVAEIERLLQSVSAGNL